MKGEYAFSSARRGPVVKIPEEEIRITIRIDTDTLNWFREQVHKRGGGNYQTLRNEALREHVGSQERALWRTVRTIIAEELQALKMA